MALPMPPVRPLTVAEYAALPEDGDIRYELQEGILVMSPSPVTDHQRCLRGLLRELEDQVPDGLEPVPDVDVDLQLVQPAQPGFVRRPDLVVVTGEAVQRVRRERALLGLLSAVELDELADHLLRPVVTVEVPADWFGSGPATPAIMERRLRPPLRRRAANRHLRREQSVADLEGVIDQLDAADAAAVVQGMCDAVEVLDDECAEAVLAKAVQWPRAQVRKLALDHLVARGAGERAHRLGREDPDATIRRCAVDATTPVDQPGVYAPAGWRTTSPDRGSGKVQARPAAARAHRVHRRRTQAHPDRPDHARRCASARGAAGDRGRDRSGDRRPRLQDHDQ